MFTETVLSSHSPTVLGRKTCTTVHYNNNRSAEIMLILIKRPIKDNVICDDEFCDIASYEHNMHSNKNAQGIESKL